MQKRVLVALEEAGVFTSGGLVKDKVCEYAPNITPSLYINKYFST